jgi:ribosomal protein L14E/L6E/L27E
MTDSPRRYLLYTPFDYNFTIIPANCDEFMWKVSPVPLWDGTYTTPGKIVARLGTRECLVSTLRTSIHFQDLKECAPNATWKICGSRATSVTVHTPGRHFDAAEFSARIGRSVFDAMESIPAQFRSPISWNVLLGSIEHDKMVSLCADIATMESTEGADIRFKLHYVPGVDDVKATAYRWRKDGSITFSYTWRSVRYRTFDMLREAMVDRHEFQDRERQEPSPPQDRNPQDRQEPSPSQDLHPQDRQEPSPSQDRQEPRAADMIVIDEPPGPSSSPRQKKRQRRHSTLKDVADIVSAAQTEMDALKAEARRLILESEMLGKEFAEYRVHAAHREEEMKSDYEAMKSERDTLAIDATRLQQEARSLVVHQSDPFELALSLLAFRSGHNIMDNGYQRLDDRLAFALTVESNAAVITAFHADVYGVLGSEEYLRFLKILFSCDVLKGRSNVLNLLGASGAPPDMHPAVVQCFESKHPRRNLGVMFIAVRNTATAPKTLTECRDAALLVALDCMIV